jgi:hypothetical protein
MVNVCDGLFKPRDVLVYCSVVHNPLKMGYSTRCAAHEVTVLTDANETCYPAVFCELNPNELSIADDRIIYIITRGLRVGFYDDR